MKICYDYMRPEKARMMRTIIEPFLKPHAKEIRLLENAGVIPAFSHESGEVLTGVVDSDNRFVDISHEIYHPDDVERKAADSEFSHREETVVYVGFFNPHWGHFVVDCLSSFWFLDEIKADRYVFSYHEGQKPVIHKNLREALMLLGVWDKIEIVDSPVRFSKLYAISNGLVSEEYVLPEVSNVFERIIRNALSRPYESPLPQKVLMSRSKLPKALLNDIGTENVERLFTANGYHAIYPEKISLTELIRFLHGAKECAAISGTLTHNMLFAPNGSKLYVIEKYAYINTYQPGVDILKNLETTYIDANYFLRSVNPGLGPFIIGPTPQLERFASDKGMKYVVESIRPRATLRRYYSLCYRHYKRRWVMPWWLDSEIASMREAYEASMDLFGPWIEGDRAIFISDMIHPRHIAKLLKKKIKSILRR